MRSHLILALNLAALTCAHTVAFADAPGCSALWITSSIPFDKIEKSEPLRMPVTIAGVEKSFVFDLSGELSWTSESRVREFGFKQLPSRYHLGALSAPTANLVSAPDVIFGNARLGKMQFLVIDKPMPESGIPNTDVVGGFLFRGNDIDLDFGAERLNLFSPDHCEGRVVYWPHQAIAVIPMTIESGTIVIPVALDGHKFRAIVSTATGQSSMNIEKAEINLGYSPEPPNPKIPSSRTISYEHRYKTLEFDGVTIQNPLLHMQLFRPGVDDPEGNFPSYYGALRSPEIIIGMDILRHLHMYVSFAEHKIYITEAGSGPSVISLPSQANP